MAAFGSAESGAGASPTAVRAAVRQRNALPITGMISFSTAIRSSMLRP